MIPRKKQIIKRNIKQKKNFFVLYRGVLKLSTRRYASLIKKLNSLLQIDVITINMATIWIHRAFASDILVRFETHGGALLWSYSYLRTFENTQFTDDSQLEGYGFVGCTDYVQLSIHEIDFAPSKECWNTNGTIEVSPEEARLFAEFSEPEGFIRGESEKIWVKQKRNSAEVDKEFEGYTTDDMCTAGIRDGVCECCGTCTNDYLD